MEIAFHFTIVKNSQGNWIPESLKTVELLCVQSINSWRNHFKKNLSGEVKHILVPGVTKVTLLLKQLQLFHLHQESLLKLCNIGQTKLPGQSILGNNETLVLRRSGNGLMFLKTKKKTKICNCKAWTFYCHSNILLFPNLVLRSFLR